MFRGQSPRMGEQPHSPHRVHTLAGPLTGRRDRVRVGVVVGRTHTSCRVASLHGGVASAAACPHLVMCQADVWDAPEAVAGVLAHDKAAQPATEECNVYAPCLLHRPVTTHAPITSRGGRGGDLEHRVHVLAPLALLPKGQATYTCEGLQPVAHCRAKPVAHVEHTSMAAVLAIHIPCTLARRYCTACPSRAHAVK